MNERKLDYKIVDEYSYELNNIVDKLNQLERGRIYELSRAQMDGYLATNIGQLRKMIIDLLSKIQNGENGIDTELAESMKSINF